MTHIQKPLVGGNPLVLIGQHFGPCWSRNAGKITAQRDGGSESRSKGTCDDPRRNPARGSYSIKDSGVEIDLVGGSGSHGEKISRVIEHRSPARIGKPRTYTRDDTALVPAETIEGEEPDLTREADHQVISIERDRSKGGA